MYSRAIHIKLLDDLSTDGFFNTLQCFVSLHRSVSTLYCDNDTNFIGGRNELRKQLAQMSEGNLKQYLAEKQIHFITSTPTASHQGGVWERQIRSIRMILNEIFQQKGRFDTSMLRTAFYEAMATVNRRPLSLPHLNNHEELPLTPNCLIAGKLGTTPVPPGDFNDESYSRSRWKRVQAVAEEFWRKWRDEYYKTITERQVWKHEHANIARGDVVLIMNKDGPRNLWRLGIMKEVHPGDDGLVRKAEVKLATAFLDNKGWPMEELSRLHRPVQKLVVLQRTGAD